LLSETRYLHIKQHTVYLPREPIFNTAINKSVQAVDYLMARQYKYTPCLGDGVRVSQRVVREGDVIGTR